MLRLDMEHSLGHKHVQGAYTTCPLCQRTLPLAFAEAHVSVCLTTPGPPPSCQPRGTGATPSGRSHSPSLAATQALLQPLSGSLPRLQRQIQPLPGPLQTPQPHGAHSSLSQGEQQQQQQHHHQPGHQQHVLRQEQPNRQQELVLHVDLAADGDVVGALGSVRSSLCEGPGETRHVGCAAASGAAVDSPGSPSEHQQPLQIQQQRLVQQPTADCAPTQQRERPGTSLPSSSQATCAPSAFDIMKQSQLRAASRCHSFFLERTQDGCWLGHCWTKGCATSAQQRLASCSCWSVTLSVASGGRGGQADGGSGKETVCLQTNVPPGDGGTISWSAAGLLSNALPPEGRWRGSQSVLKSALQKAVRLGRASCAVRAALHLVKEDGGAAQLLRRLSVVCVEDAILHPGLSLVVWLMAAQAKGYTLGASHVEALLAVVYQLAAVQVRDGLPDPWAGDGTAPAASAVSAVPQGPVLLSHVDDLGLPPLEACLVKCLLMRASYGGMGGDVRMMRGFAAYWAARFKGTAVAPPPSPAQPPAGRSEGPAEAPREAVADHAGRPSVGIQPGCCGGAAPCTAASPDPYDRPGPHGDAPGRHSILAVRPGPDHCPEPPSEDGRGVPYRFDPGRGGDTKAPGDVRGKGGTGHGWEPAGSRQGGHKTEPSSGAPTEPQHPPGRPDSLVRGEAEVTAPAEGVAAPAEEAAATFAATEEQSRRRRRRPAETDIPALEEALRRCSSGPATCASACSQVTQEGPSQAALLPRVSDAYFAVRLQTEDAPPSCGGFMPASQLMAEALSEQRSLQRLAAATAQRQLQQSQSGSQAVGSAISPWRPTQLGISQPRTLSPGLKAVRAHSGMCQTGTSTPPYMQQATPVPCAGVARTKWRCCAEGPADGTSGCGGRRQSPWLAYLFDLYDQVPVPVSLCQIAVVGPMRRSDVPLSAVDFHVSDVVTQLLERPDVQAQAPGGPGAAPEDLEDSLKSAMWHFRSGKNPKTWIHTLSPCCKAAPDGVCPEHRSLEVQLAQEASARQRLAALWDAAAPWADRYSVSYIARRFG